MNPEKSFEEAQFQYSLGEHDVARRLLESFLRSNPDHTDGWELMVDLARNDGEAERARAGLKRAQEQSESKDYSLSAEHSLDHEADAAEAPAAAGPVFAVPGIQIPVGEGTLDMRNYALTTLVLYIFGGFIAGLIANIVFLGMARNQRSQGRTVENEGCLRQTLAAGGIVVLVMLIGGFILFIVPILLE